MFIYLSLVVAIIGFLMIIIYSPPTSPPAPRAAVLAEIGKILAFCGSLAFLLQFPEVLKLPH